VRLAIESFLPQLRGRKVILHEDNTAVVATLSKLATRSPVMMTELRRLWHLLNDISIQPRYIRSAGNMWADNLNRELDRDDWQLNTRIFSYLRADWGPHSMDRFARYGLLALSSRTYAPSHATHQYTRDQPATSSANLPRRRRGRLP
jgi:hypothetical protein